MSVDALQVVTGSLAPSSAVVKLSGKLIREFKGVWIEDMRTNICVNMYFGGESWLCRNISRQEIRHCFVKEGHPLSFFVVGWQARPFVSRARPTRSEASCRMRCARDGHDACHAG